MNRLVQDSSSTTTATIPSQDLWISVSSLNRNGPTAIKDSLGWFYPIDPIPEANFDRENRSFRPRDTATNHNLSRQPLGTVDRHFPTLSMPARTTEKNDRGVVGGRRWVVNGSGQYLDAEVESAAWGLSDEIGRLKIGEVSSDLEEARLPIHTPPNSKLASANVAQITEASPLDSSSSNSSSPHTPDPQISHSRGASADLGSRDSLTGNALLAHPPLKNASVEAKERPHSFSGGLSNADLRRLQQVGDSDHDRQFQQQQWAQNQYRDANTEQLSYPSLTNQVHRPIPQQQYNYASNLQIHPNESNIDESHLEYNTPQQQRFGGAPPVSQGPVLNQNGLLSSPRSQFVQPRATNGAQAMNYRQNNRAFAQQAPTPNPLGYTNGHTSHLSLGNTQQLYDMMLPAPGHHDNHPAVTRVQQQHNVYRATHHHSASDPSAIRDAATLALLSNNMQAFAPNMFQPGIPPAMQLYPGQFYGAQDLAVQQLMAARLQAQYSGPYGLGAPATAQSGIPLENSATSPVSSNGQQGGPSANNRKLGLYKTELCRSWEEKGSCRYGAKCQFAHGEEELRRVSRHPKYKTEICKTFWVSGSCPYGKRCCFIHTELQGGNGNGETTPSQTPTTTTRERSNSDPDTSASISLLSRISQRAQQDGSPTATATPIMPTPTSAFPATRPPTGSLRVDTTNVDHSMKQNKSAYPTFASNGILLPAPEQVTIKSPAPVTAGPDLGRHNLARMDIVGYPSHHKRGSTSSSNPRHSFGSDDLSFSPSPPAGGHSYTLSSGSESPVQPVPTRANGHVRAGSAGNWASFSRSNLSTSAFPHGPSPAGEIMSNSPWSSNDLAVGSSRLNEKAWA
ncbi:hypothetical protein CPB83DRAFT_888206 [Crepidotus variabilis]|uniref:C3H1-type domain-containing protein n=1 Tax=Crepidotus variabilis TaxID=179855 RepID=A0A9P6EU40_9AGAR|nr:hypothetical protein CPB83DRAFT_888206 [Crepidotus variabilis]